MHRSFWSLVAFVAMAATSQAQTFITGRVVDSGGSPVPFTNIDAFDSNGIEVTLNNDGADGNGDFLTEIVDGPGLYDFLFRPPRGAALQIARRNGVFVTGTVNLGTITLADANLISGRLLDPAATPLVGLALEVEDATTGLPVEIPHPRTDASGFFDLAVPPGTCDLFIDPDGFGASLIAPDQRLDLDVSNSDLALGNIQLEPGYLVTAVLQNGAGQPVNGADSDTIDSATEVKLFTPGDNSDASGFLDFVVPAGTYDVQLEPVFSDRLVGLEILGVVINSNTHLGTFQFDAGVALTGNIVDPLGAPAVNVDLDAFFSSDGSLIHTSGDNTDVNGNYRAVVPVGTLDLVYRPPLDEPLRGVAMSDVNVSGDTVVDVTLLDCPAPTNYGFGAVGSGGFTPTIASIGDLPRLGVDAFTLEVDQGLGGAPCLLFLGFDDTQAAGNGWTLWVEPFFTFRLRLGGPNGVPGAGRLALPSALEEDPNLDGVSLFLQAIVLDGGAPGSFAATDGLEILLCR